jgi:NADH-quinone oxidoreductase subunit N
MKALILLSSLGVISLLSEIFRFKKVLYPIVLFGLIGALVLNMMDWNLQNNLFFGMMRVDHYAVAFSSVLIITVIFWYMMAASYFKEESNQTDRTTLILFALVGGVIMTSYTNMAMLFLGIEILSISVYVLAGSNKNDPSSNEAAFKYLIMGAFATGFLLFGITLIYGATRSFDLTEIANAILINQSKISPIFYVGVLLMLVGMLFKISAAPFHFWAPDVYQGAPTVITAYMATVVKTAAFAAFLKLFMTCFVAVSETWMDVVWVAAALTLLVGNITAVLQTSVKRMLAYSSIAHAGYMLLALLAANNYTTSGILYYTLAYSIGSIATFGVLKIVSETSGNDSLDAFNGLGKRNPLLAFVMTVALLSLAGIPPAAGFFAKYYIFTAAFQAGYPILVLIAIVASLVGVYYYFKIIIAMYFKSSESSAIISTMNQKLLFLLLAAITLALGILPEMVIKLL